MPCRSERVPGLGRKAAHEPGSGEGLPDAVTLKPRPGRREGAMWMASWGKSMLGGRAERQRQELEVLVCSPRLRNGKVVPK